MKRSDIQKRISELDAELGWYQNIDLGRGLNTKTRRVWGEPIDHPRERWEMIQRAVPHDLSGMSVLDIGCNAGFLAFEAVSRGAEAVVGIDTNPGYIEQAEFCAEVLGVEVDFRVMNVYELDQLDRTFDLVFFVGTLYHCKKLAVAVEQASAACSQLLIVESAIDPAETDIPYVRFVRSSKYAGPGAEGDSRLPGHWHPNMVALEALFMEEGFSETERLAKVGGRGAIAARR